MKSQQHEWTVSRKRRSNGDMRLMLRRAKRVKLELQSIKGLQSSTLREESETNRKVTEELATANQALKKLEDEESAEPESEGLVAARERLYEQILRPWPE